MARRTKEIKITTGRDAGKTFLITEKSALDVERFCTKLLLAIGKNTNIGAVFAAHGSISALANSDTVLEMICSLDSDMAQSLMDEMLTCIQFQYKVNGQIGSRDIDEEDIEEVSTLLTLRQEVVALHVGFTETETQ